MRRRIPVGVAALAVGIAIVAGLSAPAFAAVSKTHASTPASATAVDSAPAVPSVWVYYQGYPTQFTCRNAGLYKVISGVAETYKCVEVSRGEYLAWALYLF